MQSKAAASPQLEGYKARDVEVLLLTDPVDSFWVRTALGFDGKPFKSVTQGAADLDNIAVKDDAAKSEADPGETATLIAAMKQALGERVQGRAVSKRLTDSAVCLVADGMMDRTLEKLLSRQKDSGVSVSAPILEINPGHPLIAALARTGEGQGRNSPSRMPAGCCWTRPSSSRASRFPILQTSRGAWPRSCRRSSPDL